MNSVGAGVAYGVMVMGLIDGGMGMGLVGATKNGTGECISVSTLPL